MSEVANIPKLRFPAFYEAYSNRPIGELIQIHSEKTKVENEFPILTSSRRGLMLQSEYYRKKNRITERSNIGFNVIPSGFMTFRNRSDNRVFVFNINTLGYTGAVSHFYPVFSVVDANIEYLTTLFNIKKYELGVLSVGTGQTVLSSNELKKAQFFFPSISEQQKIASFLTAVDNKIEQMSKKQELLSEYKKGLMQQIFSQELRFKADDGSDYADWEEKKLGDVLFEHKLKKINNEEVFSVSVHKGLINQIEHLGRSFSAENTANYNLVKPGDIVYTKSPTGSFPYGIIKQSKISNDVIVSPLYGVFTPETSSLGYMLNVFFESKINVHNYLHSIIQKGAKNTINITNNTFLSKSLTLPVDQIEQTKIGSFLYYFDIKIEQIGKQLDESKQFKKALLQQMFV